MIRAALIAALLAGPVLAETPIEDTEKSLMFAGRCLSQMLTGAEIDVENLALMPEVPAKGHLFGESGEVYYGEDDSVVMVLHKPTHCGVNVFDESAEDMAGFLSYWLERDQSPFQITETVTLDNGDVRIAYDGHCTECGFDVHARGYWFRTEGFAIYRVFATKPEGA